MGWSTRTVGVLAVALAGLVAVAAPADAGTTPVTLLVGVDGPGATAALTAAGVDVVDVTPELGVLEIEVPAALAEHATQALGRAPGIGFVEPDHPVQADVVPTDTFWSYQWGARRISAPTAWDRSTGSPSITIAVLDTGVDPGPEFDGKLTAGVDFVNDDSDASDDHGHGTSVAVVAAADANDGGVAGLCWTCRVMPVKVLDSTGAGSSYDIAQGITWATDQGADVIAMSLGGLGSSLAVERAVTYARAAGAILVAAAGNEGQSMPNYPAANPGVLGVAGSDSNDGRYSWSNHGSWVDVAAPGCNGAPIPGGYGDFCGTSSATPVVAGVAALGLAMGADAATVEAAVTTTAVPVGSWVGHGRIDAAATLAAVQAVLDQPAASGDPGTGGTGGDAPVEVLRAAGDDRVGTSVALAQRAFPDGADTVVLARSDSFADALAAAPLAATLGGPVLLTPATGIRSDVAAVLRSLGADAAVLIGGTGALSAGVASDLRNAGITDVRRIAGGNRFDTARQIALEVGGTAAYVVEGVSSAAGRGWPDAVAVSGLAALERRPILLTTSGALPAETRDALQALGATDVTIVGGTSAVSDAVRGELASFTDVVRIAGATRYDTSAKLASKAVAAGADGDHVLLATGRSWPDALAAGPAAGALGAVLLLVDGADITGSPAAAAWLDGRPALRQVVLVGGTTSVSTAVETTVSGMGG